MTTPDNLLDRLAPASAAATRWFISLQDGEDVEHRRREFELWRQADPAHAAAYARIEALWQASGAMSGLTIDQDRRRLLGGGVATLAAVLAGYGVMRTHPLATYRTGTGERRTVALPDGSVAELASKTVLDVSYGDGRRRLRLLEGEAWFQVAPDKARPFVVEVAGGTVTALGTAFSTSLIGDRAQVTVTEHAVEVARRGQTRRVQAGQGVSFGPAGMSAVDPSEPNALSWRTGVLVFEARPLGEVVRVLDRWRNGRTVILDEALAKRPVTLMVPLDAAGSAVTDLGRTVSARVTHVTPLLTVLSLK